MRKVMAIFRRELTAYLYTPLAYAAAGAFLVISGYFFAVMLVNSRAASMVWFFGNMGLMTLFIAPILTMRLLAEEARMGTDEILMTTPVTTWQVVTGKYLAATAVFGLILGITFTYPWILERFGDPDWGPVFSGYLGFFLMGATFLAAGVLTSALTDNQMVAGVLGFTLLLLLWVIDWAAGAVGGLVGEILMALSVTRPLLDFRTGIVDPGQVLFYLSMIFLFLFLSVRVLDRRTWSG